ncbi:uncharacterized protein LTR77_006986 [Saxophila tyrrhenica]|uniref:Uncharacterized protein n=1 Tax=Saxophila tyrrhenica TaxID=1690608 RepID=A0AAV9PAH2_9PEZI|nr:hypothetical protein LTR77_006986 [Saxophila tyrrhenica]
MPVWKSTGHVVKTASGPATHYDITTGNPLPTISGGSSGNGSFVDLSGDTEGVVEYAFSSDSDTDTSKDDQSSTSPPGEQDLILNPGPGHQSLASSVHLSAPANTRVGSTVITNQSPGHQDSHPTSDVEPLPILGSKAQEKTYQAAMPTPLDPSNFFSHLDGMKGFDHSSTKQKQRWSRQGDLSFNPSTKFFCQPPAVLQRGPVLRDQYIPGMFSVQALASGGPSTTNQAQQGVMPEDQQIQPSPPLR